MKRWALGLLLGLFLHNFTFILPYAFLNRLQNLPQAHTFLAFLFLINLWVILEAHFSRIKKELETSPPSSLIPLLMGLALFINLFLGVLEQMQAPKNLSPFAFFGGFLILGGIALRLVSIAVLQNRFLDSIDLRTDHTLQTSGIYSKIRHPSELGTLLIVLGSLVLLQSPWSLIFLAVLVFPLILLRVYKEDQLLSEYFCHQFTLYKAKTGALIPWKISFKK